MTKQFLVTLVLLTGLTSPVWAKDVVTVKNIGLELAHDLAMASLKACREMGYQVSVVVVDRGMNLRIALRDDLAARFTLEIAQRKANMTVMAGIDSGPFRKNNRDIRLDLNHIPGLIVMEGGVGIPAAGTRIGAVGVSGAPGGDIDEACAKKGIAAIQERLDFIE